MLFVLRLLRPLLRRWAHEGLSEVLSKPAVDALFVEVISALNRGEHRSVIVREPSFGGRLMVACAALTAELYEALLRRGLEESRARQLSARVTWAAYRRMAKPPWWIARSVSRRPERRLRQATSVFRCFPFGPPAYRMADRPSAPGVVAFDVRRCPVAEYFRARELGELCQESWCDLDFPLAARWGARLERPRTLAGGADHCDFRWIVDANANARTADRFGAGH